MAPLVPEAELQRLEQLATEHSRAGRTFEAAQAWSRVLRLAPDHLVALTQIGQDAYHAGDFDIARAAFDRATRVEAENPRRWVDLAMACDRMGDVGAAHTALTEALRREPRYLSALLMRGRLRQAAGDAAAAATSYSAALAVAASSREPLASFLLPMLDQAQRFVEQRRAMLAEYLDARLLPLLAERDGADAQRFRLSVDVLTGRKRRYVSEASAYWYPSLPSVEFYERERLPWLDAVEAETDAIRNEFLAVAGPGTGFAPYIQYGEDQPLDQWAHLNRNTNWSALHLVQGGRLVEANANRCPRTMQVWADNIPAPVQSGRTPVLLFSLLQPRTHIPPHTGVSNVRLLAHLPLVVPKDCRFRVGNSVREWQPGRAWVFDDTVEHEAWNGSDQPRAILIFDVWHPDLSQEERQLISRLHEVLDAFDPAGRMAYTG